MENASSALPYEVVESITRGGTTFELLEHGPLGGVGSLASAPDLYQLNRTGTRLRQLRIRLTNDAVRTEPGALQFLKGTLQMRRSHSTAAWGRAAPGQRTVDGGRSA